MNFKSKTAKLMGALSTVFMLSGCDQSTHVNEDFDHFNDLLEYNIDKDHVPRSSYVYDTKTGHMHLYVFDFFDKSLDDPYAGKKIVFKYNLSEDKELLTHFKDNAPELWDAIKLEAKKLKSQDGSYTSRYVQFSHNANGRNLHVKKAAYQAGFVDGDITCYLNTTDHYPIDKAQGTMAELTVADVYVKGICMTNNEAEGIKPTP